MAGLLCSSIKAFVKSCLSKPLSYTPASVLPALFGRQCFFHTYGSSLFVCALNQFLRDTGLHPLRLVAVCVVSWRTLAFVLGLLNPFRFSGNLSCIAEITFRYNVGLSPVILLKLQQRDRKRRKKRREIGKGSGIKHKKERETDK
jgi:hypothetical protein